MTFCPRVVLLIGLLLPGVVASAAPLDESRRPAHVLNRLAFGPTTTDLERVKTLGVEGYIAEQLDPALITPSAALDQNLVRLTTLNLSVVALYLEYGPTVRGRGQKPDRKVVRETRQRARVILDEASTARLRRAIESPRQLEEVMVDFWFNHFNVFANKGLDHLWIGAYEREAIRPHVFGRFRDLLGATARHPAMLFYLDNWQNTAPGSPGARGRFKGLNENYARELMELHTLGVNGGYTQQDIISLARIFTGWGFVLPRARARGSQGGFRFDAARHDASEKVFLGRTIRGAGIEEGEQALDMLARHPSTARHIAYKLAQYFVADEPPATLVERLAGRFRDTDGDIRAVLKDLFASPEFWDERYFGAKFKTPYHYVVSAVRASGVSVENHRPLRGALFHQGMPLYLCQTPDGYKNTEAAWLNPDAMMRRLSFAAALGSGRLSLGGKTALRSGGPDIAAKPLDAYRLMRLAANHYSENTRTTIAEAAPALKAALILGSPEFMRR